MPTPGGTEGERRYWEGPPGPDRQYRVIGGSVADLLKSPCKDSKVKRLSRHQKTRNLSRF